MFTASPDLRAALDVVRETDPGLYSRMRQPAWRLSTDFGVFTTSPGILAELTMEDASLGVTQRVSWRTGARLAATRVWVNSSLSAQVSDDQDTPLRYVQAMIIAHEFCHVIQPDMPAPGAMERDAFSAADAFSARLPEPYATRMLALSRDGASIELPGATEAMAYYTGDYSRTPLPYGAGTTHGMTQRHYQALADTLRSARAIAISRHGDAGAASVDLVTDMLAARLAAGNERFRVQTFLNAVRDVARERVS